MFTRTGLIVLGVASAALVVGLLCGWPELTALGAGVAAAPLVARLRARRPPPFTVSRFVSPERVQVGGTATSLLTVRNDGTRRTRPLVAFESIGGGDRRGAVAVALPALDPGESAPPLSIALAAERRGIHVIGPLRYGRPDPFGFTTGVGAHAATTLLTVHPRVHALRPLGAGTTRDLDGPTSDLAREGGIAFHGLRTYVAGDDVRLVDWRATARSATGDLYVRQHVETVRPDLDVLVDTAAERYPAGAAFELAMEITASVVAGSIAASHPVRLRTTSAEPEPFLADNAGTSLALGPLLDGLAVLEPVAAASLELATRSLPAGEPGRNLVLVTGAVDEADLLAAIEDLRRYARIIVVTTVSAGRADATRLGRAVVLRVGEPGAFVRLWDGAAA